MTLKIELRRKLLQIHKNYKKYKIGRFTSTGRFLSSDSLNIVKCFVNVRQIFPFKICLNKTQTCSEIITKVDQSGVAALTCSKISFKHIQAKLSQSENESKSFTIISSFIELKQLSKPKWKNSISFKNSSFSLVWKFLMKLRPWKWKEVVNWKACNGRS